MGLHSHQVHQDQSKSATVYVRHRPETTLLYQIVQEYWPEFQAEMASHGKHLPAYVTKEFDEYLLSTMVLFSSYCEQSAPINVRLRSIT